MRCVSHWFSLDSHLGRWGLENHRGKVILLQRSILSGLRVLEGWQGCIGGHPRRQVGDLPGSSKEKGL